MGYEAAEAYSAEDDNDDASDGTGSDGSVLRSTPDAVGEALSPEQAQLVEEMKSKEALAAQTGVELLRLRARDAAKAQYEEEQSAHAVYTWQQVSHDDAFNMSRNRTMPDIGYMTETPNSPPLPLFYSGKINGVHGDSEAGKSWLMQWVCVQEIRSRRHVLYIDFEDDAGGVYERLLKLGVGESEIREFFHYVNPRNKLTLFERVSYLQLISMDVHKSLAVVDGVTEAMSLENLTGRDEGEVAKWHTLVTKPLAEAGWGVGMIDHTPHGESRVIGSQHKRAAITGVSYLLDSVASFAPGQAGRSILRVEKDRPGGIRAEAAPGSRPQWYGTFVLDATLSYLQPAIWPWKPEEAGTDADYDREPPEKAQRAVLDFVQGSPGADTRTIRTAVRGSKTEHVQWAISWLVDHGNLRTERDGRRTLHFYDHGTGEVG